MAAPQDIELADLNTATAAPPAEPDTSPTSSVLTFRTAPIHQSFPFLNLPPELRLLIAELTLLTTSTLSWQGQYINDRTTKSRHVGLVCNGQAQYLPTRYNIAALVLVSRAIYTSLAPLFYAHNTFRFRSLAPGLPLAFESRMFTMNLRHLIIGIPTTLTDRRRAVTRTDRRDAERIEEIVRACAGLREFVINVPAVREDAGVGARRAARLVKVRLWTKRLAFLWLATNLIWLSVWWIGKLTRK